MSKRASPTKKPKFPSVLIPYKQFLTEPDRVEEYLGCDGRNCNIVVNGPRALLCQSANAETKILLRLHEAGLLKSFDPNPPVWPKR
jgi:hypothetical protein